MSTVAPFSIKRDYAVGKQLMDIGRATTYEQFARIVRILKLRGALAGAVTPILCRLVELVNEACPGYEWLLNLDHLGFRTHKIAERAETDVFNLDKQCSQDWMLAEAAWLMTAAYLNDKSTEKVQALFDLLPTQENNSVINGIRIATEGELEERRPTPLYYLRDW
jgi:hypothetical protein